MAPGIKMKKYARRTSLNKQKTRVLPIIVSAAVFLTLCLVISVFLGLSLGQRAEKYQQSKHFDFSAESYLSGAKEVKAVDAYIYPYGADVRAYIARGVTDFSICLCDAEGKLSYPSKLGVLNGFCTTAEQRLLSEQIDYIHEYSGYACAYFYVRSFQTEDSVLRDLYKSYEIALIREAVLSGVDDIMLVGLPIDDESIAEVEQYVSRVYSAAEDAVVGVLVTPELLSLTEQHVYHASRIREACDYIALDLRGLAPDADLVTESQSGDASADESGSEGSELNRMLGKMEYYIRSYSMRIVLSKENAALYDSAKRLGVVNIQIIGDQIT